MHVVLPRHVALELREHAENACPGEACGLLAAGADPIRIDDYVPMTNTASHPDGFRIDPIDFARAEARIRERGQTLAGFFHSHPASAAAPSEADRRQAWPGALQLILGLGPRGGGLKAFVRREDRLEAVPVEVEA